jgi:hypothetical protein
MAWLRTESTTDVHDAMRVASRRNTDLEAFGGNHDGLCRAECFSFLICSTPCQTRTASHTRISELVRASDQLCRSDHPPKIPRPRHHALVLEA